MQHVHGGLQARLAGYAGAIIGGFVLAKILGAVFHLAPPLQATVEGAKLRLVVFAVTLIVLMLIRPQGVFAHHEFSWAWVKRTLGGKSDKASEVTA
jgi:branched-chain amino acid transport system permease protein